MANETNKAQGEKSATTTPTGITLSPETLAIIQALSQVQVQALADAIKANAPRRIKTIADITPASVFNPTGKFNRTLKRPMLDNGQPINMETVTDEEIELLDQVVPGRFGGGLFTIVERHNGPESQIQMWYPNRTPDQRNELSAAMGRTRADRLRKCIAEAKEQGLIKS